jgi:hypothetical protein
MACSRFLTQPDRDIVLGQGVTSLSLPVRLFFRFRHAIGLFMGLL